MIDKQAASRVPIPPLAFQDYPVDVHIRIYQDGARYRAYISAVGRDQRIPISMSHEDLRVLNEQLQQQMQTVSSEITAANSHPGRSLLQSLAETGHYAFKQVFGHPNAIAVIRELLDLSSDISIQITSEGFFLPWELMYPANLEGDKGPSYKHFWGMNYVISRVIAQEARPGAFVSPIIQIAQRPKVGLLTYNRLSSVVDQEIPFFEKLRKDGKIALFKLRPLNPEQRRDEYNAFKSFWEEAFNLAHLACHAFYEGEAPNKSHILLSDEFSVTLMDMEVYGIEINGHPLVILNACETGNLNPLYTANFAAAFLKHGARGVVATECAVTDDFAADFAQQLYKHLLAGEPLGQSLLATRRYFLEEHNNPSGLLYSMYAPPSIHLVQKGD
jgi:hypothetical protein